MDLGLHRQLNLRKPRLVTQPIQSAAYQAIPAQGLLILLKGQPQLLKGGTRRVQAQEAEVIFTDNHPASETRDDH